MHKESSHNIARTKFIFSYKSFYASFSNVYAWFGMSILFISLARIISDYFQLGLAHVVEQIIEYYILLTYYIFMPFEWAFSIELNQTYKDLVVLWLSFHAIFFRVVIALIHVEFDGGEEDSIVYGRHNIINYIESLQYFFDVFKEDFATYIFSVGPFSAKWTYFIVGLILWPYFIYRMVKYPYVIRIIRGSEFAIFNDLDNIENDLSDRDRYHIIMNMRYVLIFQMIAVFSALIVSIIAGAYGI